MLILAAVFASLVAAATSDAAAVFGVTPTKSALPEWLTIQQDRDRFAQYLELARQRHAECIQKAKDAYFSGGPAADQESMDALEFDEYQIEAPGDIPDFVEELQRRVFVTAASTPLFSEKECQDMVKNAEEHFARASNGEWSTLPSGQYDVAGFWIKDIPACHEWFNRMLQERLFPLLVKQFPHFCDSMEDLVVDNAYLFKYTPETGRRTDVHTDSGCLSFTIALNGQDSYKGGGTWFDGLQGDQNVITMNTGQCTVRPGGVRHCGHAVTEGTRYIIGGFCMNNKKTEYVRMLLGVGSEEAAKNNFEKAKGALEAAVALNPNFDGPYSHLADIFTKEGNTAMAQKVLEHCFNNVSPSSGEIAYSLGVIYLDQSQWEGAKKCMEACLASDEMDVGAMMVMAQACSGLGERSREEEWYQQIISTPGAADDVKGKAYCNLGVLHEGSPQEIEYYEKSISLVQDSFTPMFSLACAYASNKDYDPAISMFRRAIEISAEQSQDQSQALQNLYRVTMLKLQSENPGGLGGDREKLMKAFMEVMGEKNYQRLATMKR